MKHHYEHHALASDVLVVAVVNYNDDGTPFDWAAYCGAVPGYEHDVEWNNVARTGAKIAENIAKVIFPQYAEINWRR